MTDHLANTSRLKRLGLLSMVLALTGTLTGAYAEDKKPVDRGAKTAREEIKSFCANIADAARDQRYLLQKEELSRLQAEVDERIAILESRKQEYEVWVNRRTEFAKQAEAGLVDIYKGMKPDAAAGQLSLVDPNLASAIIMKLSSRQSSLILAEMEPKKAAMVTAIISAFSNRNTSRNPT